MQKSGLILLAIALIAISNGPIAFKWLTRRAERRARRERERLGRLPTTGLVEEARARIQSEGWGRFAAAARIASQREWTDARLLECLDDLRREALAETPGDFGREGNLFAFYDSGLNAIVEVLRERTGSSG